MGDEHPWADDDWIAHETHHLLWPDLWEKLRPSAPPPPEDERIRWWNYLDSGDPIAYRLVKTREWLDKPRENEGVQGVRPWSDYFDFGTIKDPQETEFSRYYLPGKAHIDYWDDEELFGHFIQNVVRVPSGQQPADESAPRDFSNPPEDRWKATVASRTFPYLLVAGLLFAAVFALYKPVVTALAFEPGARDVLRDVGGLALLLFGMTSAVRIPRLTKNWRWRVGSWLILGAAMVAYPFVVREETRQALEALFKPVVTALAFEPGARDVLRDVGSLALLPFGMTSAVTIPRLTNNWGRPVGGWLILGTAMVAYPFVVRALEAIFPHTGGMLGTVLLIAVFCSLVVWQRPKWGARVLPVVGVLFAAWLVFRLLVPDLPVGDERDLDVWPVLLGGAAFFYLWWLATLLFDLTFVWHHYVRSAAVADHLRKHMKEVHDTTAPANG